MQAAFALVCLALFMLIWTRSTVGLPFEPNVDEPIPIIWAAGCSLAATLGLIVFMTGCLGLPLYD